MWYWWWLLDPNPSGLALTVYLICNTLNLIGCIFLLAAMYQSERKCRKKLA